MANSLSQLIGTRNALVGIVGLGYVGLPLMKAFVESGFRVVGFDVDQTKIDVLNEGRSYIGHIESEWVSRCLEAEEIQFTGDMNRLSEVNAILICVPTPLNKHRDPDLQFVRSTAQQISANLVRGQLVVLESTTYPGTTRDVVLPILSQSGLKVGDDYYLAYSPEREDPGNLDFSTQRIPKVIGGSDTESLQLADELYSAVVEETVVVSSCEIAEACKILENTYRSVNIAMVNELKTLFDRLEIDIWEVIEAAKSKPFGFQAFYPGPGLGGHCIPIDPFYLSWLARENGFATRFIELAGEVNAGMPEYVVKRTEEALSQRGKALSDCEIGILGVAYKRDIEDPRESPAFRLFELLCEKGAGLSYNDPHVPQLPEMRHYDVPDLTSQELTEAYLASRDCVIIVTDHSAYDYRFIVQHAPLVVDTRNATGQLDEGLHKIVKA